MRKTFIVLLTATVAAGPAAASDGKTEAIAVVKRWVDNFNGGGPKAVTVTCADQTDIIGAFPPYVWNGTGACAHWAGDWEVFTRKNQLSACAMALGTPRHTDATADRAYVVVDAEFTCIDRGKPLREPGWTWTVALKKAGSDWRIIGWAWGSPADSTIKAHQ